MNRARTDKRTQLVEAASALFYQQGVHITTLADIATLGNVPLGNVYYYFQSKDSIIVAVIEHHRKTLQNHFSELDNIVDPKERLRAFIRKQLQSQEEIASSGDKIGSLCQELNKQEGPVAEATAQLMQDILDWCEKQFAALGKAEPFKQALSLVSRLQGINLITLAFKNPSFIEQQQEHLLNFVEKA